MGVLLLIIILAMFYMAYIFTSDKFDYSKYTNKTIISKINKEWITLKDIETININQAKVVFYWSDDSELKYYCENQNRLLQNKELKIKQSYCYIIVPSKTINIKIKQASVVIIDLKNSINIDMEQAQMSIFENKNPYTYNIQSEESKIIDLKSKKSNIQIKGKIFQSEIKKYEY